ncbi:hypothetical protein [Acidiphilium sp.]|uniref:hypothetical protein n=1 Tax=Acidiphilium sp. TaxID=527 RepID=UPI003CFF712F
MDLQIFNADFIDIKTPLRSPADPAQDERVARVRAAADGRERAGTVAAAGEETGR